jgi:hypothetical protein
MTAAAERPTTPRRSEVESIVFRGPARECSVPLPDAERLSRELRRVSCDGRDAASSAARRIDVALSAEGYEVGPLPEREASAIQLAIERVGRPQARSAPIVRLDEMLLAEYGATPA